MARGMQKIQAQQKNQAKATAKKKSDAPNNKEAGQAALVHKCTVCMLQMADIKTYKQHWENRHSKAPLPDVLKEA